MAERSAKKASTRRDLASDPRDRSIVFDLIWDVLKHGEWMDYDEVIERVGQRVPPNIGYHFYYKRNSDKVPTEVAIRKGCRKIVVFTLGNNARPNKNPRPRFQIKYDERKMVRALLGDPPPTDEQVEGEVQPVGKTSELKYRKADVLTILRENRDKHQAIFDEACDGYKQEGIRQLEAHLDRIKNGQRLRVAISIPVPENHTKDYDRVIKMLEMTTDDEVVLTEDEVGMYIMDDWAWRRQFIASNSLYSSTAQSLQGDTF